VVKQGCTLGELYAQALDLAWDDKEAILEEISGEELEREEREREAIIKETFGEWM